ncbi:hypothetical protein [Buttiauxella sp. 3AFRM03]|uniref:hypothetical protein n=1 Tax=Buttiauxella sp. 3AFRM03 TaxID=2479367 RepID=UPI001EE481A8|nr:hypothetical protein [Buttiauxella sp. 3AFRM03]
MLTGDVFDDEGNQPDSVTITISDFPDYYDIPFVIPTSQMVNLVLTWNLRFDDPFDPDSIAIAATQPLVDYINSLAVSEPMSIYQIGSVFLASISKLVEPSQVSLIETNIWIDGVIAEPAPESGLIYGNKYKYFTTDQSYVMVKQYGS